MGDGSDPRGQTTGAMVYEALRAFNQKKPVYILASHSHFYLADIFNTDDRKKNHEEPLQGWIAGAGGAERYLMPDKTPWLQYGYMVGTVSSGGKIDFEFKPVSQDDIPAAVKKRYPEDLIPWCWEKNSKAKTPHPAYSSKNCPLPTPDAEKAKATPKR